MEWPWAFIPRLKRICAKQIEPLELVCEMRDLGYHVKNEERPERANSQSKIWFPFSGIVPTKAINPRARQRIKVTSGRPRLSIYMKIFGACPFSARACNVRVAP